MKAAHQGYDRAELMEMEAELQGLREAKGALQDRLDGAQTAAASVLDRVKEIGDMVESLELAADALYREL